MTTAMGGWPVAWRRTAFVLFTPDAVRRHLVPAMLERLATQGFELQQGALVNAGPAELDALYADHIASGWSTYRYRLLDQLFRLGPCCAALLTADDDVPHERLGALKGATNPGDAAAGTLRHDFGAVNSILGLLHSSDDAAASESEATIFLRGQRLLPPDQLRAALELHHAARPREHRQHDWVVGATHAQIVQQWLDVIDAAVLKELHASAAELGPPGLANPAVRRRTAEALARLSPPVVVEFLQEVPSPSRAHPFAFEKFFAAVDPLGLVVDDWSRLVLMTSEHFPAVVGWQRR